MSEATNQPASAEAEPKPVQPLGEPSAQTPAQPASEPEDVFDKDRAMATIQKLREIEKQYKRDQKEFERLKAEEQKRIEEQMTEQERLQKQNAELAAKLRETEDAVVRRDVIAEVELPAAFAERLKGSTREELLDDAKKLKELLPKASKQPVQTVTNPGSGDIKETEAQMRERLFGRQTNVFSVDEIVKKGGGVIWNTEQN